MDIRHVFDFNKALEHGKWAWPGGYECAFLADDGEFLSFEAAQENAGQIRDAVIAQTNNGWRVVGFGVVETDENPLCAHTGKLISSIGVPC
ncbi:hypothetical protein F6X40_10335 [Paraburkholderia sp. UCT31]|uniref:hypothetical protein n=1 Tax=Paraburkholderia sp. UCT31 TaxID=2615209 RepID=UPI0016555B4A|nr:hypothetical protein [Paraburkholderia sp. UCT31]MBC8737205.1 hypothetical protein [Paraburkholderia sp. UCT31]